MLRRSPLVECVSVLPGNRCLQNVRNDNSNKGTTARLNETRFGPKKSRPNISRPIKSRHFLMKLPDNFQMREHLRPCRFHIRFYNKKNPAPFTMFNSFSHPFLCVNICLLWENIECSPLLVTNVNLKIITSLWPTSNNLFTGIYRCCSSIYTIYL